MLKMPTAVILVGGLGTRLRPLTLRTPKPLLKIAGKPFLHHLLHNLSSHGVKKCILLTGYKHQMIRRFCGNGSKWGMKVQYSQETRPLGTGGAIMRAKGKFSGAVLVMNGDSWVGLELEKFLRFHRRLHSPATLFAMKGKLSARGAVYLGNNGRVVGFSEKGKSGVGFFNTGAYLLEQSALGFLQQKIKNGSLGDSFSLEKDGFPLLISKKSLHAYVGTGHFLDIGTFESLSYAERFFDRIGFGRQKTK
jgi:NDP-sugar pyrophosphorylase family protein